MAWDGVERRRQKRYGVTNAIVRYKKGGAILSFLLPASQKYLVLNLSVQGIGFIAKEEVTLGQKLTVSITAPPRKGTVSATGRVVWVQKSHDQNAYHVGLELTRLSTRSAAYLQALVDSAVMDKLMMSTRVYLKELDKL